MAGWPLSHSPLNSTAHESGLWSGNLEWPQEVAGSLLDEEEYKTTQAACRRIFHVAVLPARLSACGVSIIDHSSPQARCSSSGLGEMSLPQLLLVPEGTTRTQARHETCVCVSVVRRVRGGSAQLT